MKEMWNRIVEQYRDSNAIYYDGNYYTYGYIDEISDKIASYVYNNGKSKYVGVSMENSAEYICTILGILKAGRAFVPIDTDYPYTRRKKIVSNCAMDLLITSSRANFYEFDIEISFFHALSKVGNIGKISSNQDENEAYVLHTSGTTGNPKGIVVEKNSLINLIIWFGKTYKIDQATRVLQMARISFDVSIEEIFGTIFNGGILFIPSTSVKVHKQRMREYMLKHSINIVQVVPVMLKNYFAEEEKIPSIQIIICGGETLSNSLKDSILKIGYSLYNNYGPTEATVDAMFYKCKLSEDVSLGECIDGCGYFILDEDMNEVLDDGEGELCLYGANLAKEYLNDLILTHEKFVIYKGRRVFRTGDLVRRGNDGIVKFIGRKDLQIKIRGQRIELEEIEEAFLSIYESACCIAACLGNKNKHIVLFYSNEYELEKDIVLDELGEILPEVMLPSEFVYYIEFPLNANGKIDRNRVVKEWTNRKKTQIMDMEQIEDEISLQIVALASEALEEKVAFDFSSCLRDIGFDSMSYVRFIVSVEEKWGLEFDEDFWIVEMDERFEKIVDEIRVKILSKTESI